MKEREKKGHTSGSMQQSGQRGRSPNALSDEQLGNCAGIIAANMEFARKKHGTCTRTSIVKGSMFRHVKIHPTVPTGQFKKKLSHLGQIVNMKIESSLWKAAHLTT